MLIWMVKIEKVPKTWNIYPKIKKEPKNWKKYPKIEQSTQKLRPFLGISAFF